MIRTRTRSAVLMAALFLASAAALICEVSWSRMLALALGGTVVSATLVLSVCMAGLALGSLAWGRWSDRCANTARLFAICQLCVIAAAALSYYCLSAAWQMAGPRLPQTARYAALLLPILLHSFCVGGAYPVMARALIRRREGIAPGLGMVSALDALGGAAGGLAAGFVLLGALGQTATLAVAAALNLAAAAATWLLPAGVDAPQPQQSSKAVKQDQNSPIYILVAAGITGLSGMALQVVWIRVLKIFLPNTSYSFALVAGLLILGLAAGGWIYRAAAPRMTRPLWWLSAALAVSGAFAGASSLLLAKLPQLVLFPLAGSLASPLARMLLPPAALSLALIAVPAVASGFAFPLLCSLYSGEVAALGRGIGTMRLLNAAGSVAGPVLAAFVLIPLAGVSRSLQLLALPLLGTAAWGAWRTRGPGARPLRLLASLALAAAALAALLAPRAMVLPPSFYQQSGARQAGVIHYRETVEGTVTVSEDARTGIRACFVNNSGVVGTTYDAIKAVKLLGHLPFLAGSRAGDVLVVGFGIGVTAATIASHPGVRRIDCVEIAPGVRDAARYFTEFNQGVALSPKVSFIPDDGRAFLTRTGATYDIISADPTHPTLGCANLYTEEYFRLCRGHLRPGGYICQYLPLHGLTPDEFRGIVKTFSTVFPRASLWLGHSHCVLLGAASPLMTASPLAMNFSDFTKQVDSLDDRLFYQDPYAVAACLMLDSAGVAALARGAQPCSDGHNYLEFFDPHAKDQVNWERNIDLLLAGQCDVAGSFPGIDRRVLSQYLAGRDEFIAGQKMKNQGRWREAVALFQSAVAKNPRNQEYRFLLEQELSQVRPPR